MSRRNQKTPKKLSANEIAAIADLGDSSTSDTDSTFFSPELRPDQTDYQLNYEGYTTPRRSRRVPVEATDTPSVVMQQSNVNVPSRSHTSKRTSTRNIELPSTSRAATTRAQPKRKPRKQKTPAQRNMIFFKEVQQLQKSTKFLIPRLPFSRLVREILMEIGDLVKFVTKEAFEALQTATELYLTQQFEDAYMLTLHRNRITLGVIDMRFLRYLFSRLNLHK